MKTPLLRIGAIVTSCVCALTALADAGDEVGIGRTAANILIADAPDHPVPMARSVFPGFTGYASSLIGFEDVIFDDPSAADGAGIFRLSPASSIAARVTHMDPGVALHNGLTIVHAGDVIELGAPAFDIHPIYNIPSLSAVPGQVFIVRYVLHDTTGLYADSAEFEVRVTPACPADYNLSHELDVADIFDFLSGWFSGLAQADFDRSGSLDVADIFGFLSAWFAGC